MDAGWVDNLFYNNGLIFLLERGDN